MDAEQFTQLVVKPTLQYIGAYSFAAERLVLGTAVHESVGLKYIKQLGNGPALGLFQMEPATHDDIWANYLRFNEPLKNAVRDLAGMRYRLRPIDASELIGNNNYACAMCRCHYKRIDEPLPDADDIPGMASYWKRHYNTVKGAGTEQDFIENYLKYIKES